ncbi:zinc finger, CCHC-type containing protein [Tanacetum coccineum]|uniref:Zinc finger, CCHC-type containing protein n=1 Tax=Tanacetum coccineum TaxID=301880 RepID=A0ABQ5CP59_9ASTR
MTDSRPVMEQYNKLLGILGRFTQHQMNIDEAIQVSCIVDKLPPSWKDFKHTLKHLKKELNLFELGSHLRTEESLRHNNSTKYNDNKGKRKHHDNTRADPNKKAKPTCQKCGKTGYIERDCKSVNVGNKANGSGTKGLVDGSTNSLKGATVHVCKDRCWFKTFESLNDGSILHIGNESTSLVHGRGCVDLRFSSGKIVSLFNVLHDKALDKFKVFKTEVELQQGSLIKGIRTDRRGEYMDTLYFQSIVVTEEVVQQLEPKLRKSKRNRTSKNFGPEFQLYLIKETRDEKEAINDEIDSIIINNTWVLADLPPGCKPLGCKWIFKTKLKVDRTIEKFKARLVIQGFRQKSGIYYFDTYAPVACISTIRLLIAMTSIHNLIIHQMDVKTAFLNGELEEEVYMSQPKGFIMPDNEKKVCKLIKSLYGLKQTPKQ